MESAVSHLGSARPSLLLGGNGDNGELEVAMVSHGVKDVFLADDGRLMGTVSVLDTPEGEKLKELLSGSPGVVFRLAGQGTVNDGEIGADYLPTHSIAIPADEDSWDGSLL